MDRANLIQINIELSNMESATNVENSFTASMVQQMENINIITHKPIICSVRSEPIVMSPKHIRRYELSVLRAINHARQNKHVLPFGLVRYINALKINKNRRNRRKKEGRNQAQQNTDLEELIAPI